MTCEDAMISHKLANYYNIIIMPTEAFFTNEHQNALKFIGYGFAIK
jgi:hypothetical protein